MTAAIIEKLEGLLERNVFLSRNDRAELEAVIVTLKVREKARQGAADE